MEFFPKVPRRLGGAVGHALTLTDLAKHQAFLSQNFAENRHKRLRQLKRLRKSLGC